MNRRHFLKNSALAFFTNGLAVPFAMADTPPKLHVPPEKAKHQRTFMQWPVSRKVHKDRFFLDILQKTIANVANAIAEFEPVVLLAAKQDHPLARRLISKKVVLWNIPTEDLWCRDSGPLFAKKPDGKLVISHIQFNGWGNRQVHKRDGKIAAHIAEHLGLEIIASGLKGEAGGVDHDGHGLLIAHESSWVHKNRNPGLSRADIEKKLLTAYGAEKVIWTPGVRNQDITDYHIDSLVRFTGPGKV